MNAKRVILSVSPDPCFKQGPTTIDFLVDSFSKAHVFQKINIDFEKQFCKYLYFRFQINEQGADEDFHEQDKQSDQKYIKILINFGAENFNQKIRKAMFLKLKNKRLASKD